MGHLDGEGVPGSGKGEISFNLIECMISYFRPKPRYAVESELGYVVLLLRSGWILTCTEHPRIVLCNVTH